LKSVTISFGELMTQLPSLQHNSNILLSSIIVWLFIF
jgi:hypothetical protein